MKQRTIIVGTDFSKGSYVALELAVDIANKMKADIHLVWICREKMLYTDDQNNYVRNLASQKMDDLCEKWQPKLTDSKITPFIVQGKVAPVIASMAQKVDATMIVIGTNGASGFEKYWMGSTAVRIVQEATCPVLSIREGFNFHKNLERILVPLNMTTSRKDGQSFWRYYTRAGTIRKLHPSSNNSYIYETSRNIYAKTKCSLYFGNYAKQKFGRRYAGIRRHHKCRPYSDKHRTRPGTIISVYRYHRPTACSPLSYTYP